MPSTAILAQGTSFAVAGTPGTALSITAVSLASPAVVTAANTLNVGDVVVFGTVTGMPEIAGRPGIVLSATSSSFTVNIDSTGFSGAGSNGTGAPQTWVLVNNIHDYTGFDGTSSEVDVTNLQSLAKEYKSGLEDFGQFSMNIDVDNTDPGQRALRAAKTAQNITYFRLIMRNKAVRVFYAFCKKFSEAGAVDGAVKASVDLRISGRPSFGEVTN